MCHLTSIIRHRGTELYMTQMQAQVIENTNELDPEIWDSLDHPSLYVSSAWLRARSRTIKGAERFISMLVADDGPIVGLSGYLVDNSSHPGFVPARVLSMDDLPDSAVQSLPGGVAALAELRAALRQRADDWTPALVLSAPGRHGCVSYKRGLDVDLKKRALGALIKTVAAQALQDQARSICWLYFGEDENPMLAEMLRERGYLSVVVGAECYLRIRWDSFNGYLSSFNAKDRWKIKYQMRTLDKAGVKVDLHGGEVLGRELASLERQWREKYGRTPSLDEIVEDYENLRSLLARELRVFVATLGGRPIGFTVFLAQGDTWYARFGGFDYSVGNLFLYFNLLFYRPIQFFIEHGVRCIHYSLKSYEAKVRRGCQLSNVVAYVRPPEAWSTLAGLLEIVDRAQRRRFDEITRQQAPQK
jgi:predicted N-acyltransferase